MTSTSSHADNIIAYQGVPGAYSQLACRTRFPDMDTLPLASFEDMLQAVVDGDARYAMVPVENSLAGRVADIHHLLPSSGLSIIGEQLSNKIGLDKEITSQGKSLPILKKTKSVTLIFNGNFYQFNIEELITKIVNELKDIYKN